jgi:hypothetical protein
MNRGPYQSWKDRNKYLDLRLFIDRYNKDPHRRTPHVDSSSRSFLHDKDYQESNE